MIVGVVLPVQAGALGRLLVPHRSTRQVFVVRAFPIAFSRPGVTHSVYLRVPLYCPVAVLGLGRSSRAAPLQAMRRGHTWRKAAT